MTVEEAYKTKLRLMLYHAQKYVGTLASDVVQDAFLKLLAKYGKEDKENLEYILFITVRNECKNHIKHKDVIDKYNRTLEEYYYYGGGKDEYARLNIEFDFVNIVYNKIQLLPKKCRRMIELFYFKEFSVTEISRYLGVTPSTVTSQLQRGRDLLRPYFTEKSPSNNRRAVNPGHMKHIK